MWTAALYIIHNLIYPVPWDLHLNFCSEMIKRNLERQKFTYIYLYIIYKTNMWTAALYIIHNLIYPVPWDLHLNFCSEMIKRNLERQN